MLTCATCHDTTHNAPTCPFPSAPMWYGPHPFRLRPPTVPCTLRDLEFQEYLTRRLEQDLEQELDRRHLLETLYG